MSYSIKQLTSADYPQWDDYVTKLNASTYLRSVWKTIIEQTFGHKTFYLYCTDSHDQIVGVLPLVQQKSLAFGNFLTSVPFFNYGGVVADSNAVTEQLLQAAQSLCQQIKAKHVELRMTQPLDESLPLIQAQNCRLDKVTMILQLPETADDLWKSIGAKRRAQAKRPIREGAEFKVGGIELLDDFYQVFARNMRDLGTPVYSKKLFHNILTCAQCQSFLALVYIKGIPVGAGFLVQDNQRLEIPWASTNRDYNRFGVNMFMYWKILEHAFTLGISEFDFGRSSVDAGTLKFKKQWGGEQEQLYWYYLLPEGEVLQPISNSNSKFQLMINLWQKLPLPIANFIGPHVVKNIP